GVQRVEVGEVHRVDLQAGWGVDPLGEADRAAVRVVGDDDVAVGGGEAQERVLGGQARREGEPVAGALEHREMGLERLPGGVAAAGVLEAARLAGGLLAERGGQRDRGHHRPGVGVGRAGAVHGAGGGALAGEVDHQRLRSFVRRSSRSERVTTATGWPPSSTRAAVVWPSSSAAASIGSPMPRVGSGGPCTSPTGRSRIDGSAMAALSSSRSRTAPDTSPSTTGGSCFTTGIWLTSYSRRISMASRTVSSGWVWTSSGRSSGRSRSRSPTVGPAARRNPWSAIQPSS